MVLFSPRSPCKVSAQSDPPADFPSPSHAQTFCPHPEGPLSCSHTHLEKMHLVGSMKCWLDNFTILMELVANL